MKYLGHVQPKLAVFEFSREDSELVWEDRYRAARAKLHQEVPSVIIVDEPKDIVISAFYAIVGIGYVTRGDLGLPREE